MILIAPAESHATLSQLRELAVTLRTVHHMDSTQIKAIGYHRFLQTVCVNNSAAIVDSLNFIELLTKTNWQFPAEPTMATASTISVASKIGPLISAFMFAIYPMQTFPNPEETTPSLCHSAIQVTRQFDRITEFMESVTIMIDTGDYDPNHVQDVMTVNHLTSITEGFRDKLQDYEVHFTSWRKSDHSQRVARLYQALYNLFVALVGALGDTHNLVFDDQNDHPVILEMVVNVNRLREMLIDIGANEEVARFDALYERVVSNHHKTRVLREEHLRHGLTEDYEHHGFDFV